MPLDDDLDAAAGPDEVDLLRARLKNAEKERNQAVVALAEHIKYEEQLERIATAANRELAPPKWLRPKRREEKGHHATLVTMLSDTHFDEVVDPAEMNGYNAFDRGIAEARLERYVERLILVSRVFTAGVEYDGCVLVLGGDLLSGNIHDLPETNEDTVLGGALYWSDRIATVLGMLADEFGKVHVPATVGNHPRFTLKERTKRRVRDNADWLISQLLVRHFEKDERVTFQVPEATSVPFDVYDTRFLLNHGQTGGGGGIGGVWPPIMRLRSQLSRRYEFDVLMLGHWHQYIPATEQGLLVNGSLKGYDEYAETKHFTPERPTQAMFLVTPENGVTDHHPVFVADRDQEGW